MCKAILCFATVLMMVSTYLILFFSSLTFESFQVTDKIAVKLNGNAANLIISPLGWVAIGCLGSSVLLVIIFGRWAAYHVKHTPDGYEVPGETVTAASSGFEAEPKGAIALEVIVHEDGMDKEPLRDDPSVVVTSAQTKEPQNGPPPPSVDGHDESGQDREAPEQKETAP